MSDPTQEIPTVFYSFGDGALTLYGRPFQGRLPRIKQSDIGLLQPLTSLLISMDLGDVVLVLEV